MLQQRGSLQEKYSFTAARGRNKSLVRNDHQYTSEGWKTRRTMITSPTWTITCSVQFAGNVTLFSCTTRHLPHFAARNPFILPTMSPFCEHTFCRHCITRALTLSPSCPVDRSPLQLSDVVPAPRIIQQMVRELTVVCPNVGCSYQCERGLLAGHLKESCSNLSAKGKGVLAAVLASDERETECEFCGAVLDCPTLNVRRDAPTNME